VANGPQLVMMALGGTASIFIGLSTYVMITRTNFDFLGGFVTAGILIAFLAGIASFVFSLPLLSIAVSSAFILLMSALILYETSNIIHGGERNYISATVTLYISIYNLFLSLLNILSFIDND